MPAEPAMTHSGRRMAEDATAAFAVQILGYVTGLVASILIARALGPSDRGIYAVAVSAAAIAVVAFHAGTELAGSYFFAERGTSLGALTRTGVFTVIVLGPLAMAAMLVLYAVGHVSLLHGLSLALFACAIASVPLQMHQLWIANLLMLSGRFRLYQRVSAIIAVAQLATVGVVFAVGGLGLTAVLVIYLGVAIVAWALCVRAARGLGPMGPPYDTALFRGILRYGLRLHGGYIAWFVLLRLDLFLVAWWLDARAAGIYAVAVLFAELAWQLTTPLGLAAVRSQMGLASAEAAKVSFQVARVNLLLAGCCATAFAATLWIVVPVLYGRAFASAYAVIVVLLPGVVAMAAFRPLYNWLVRVAPPLRLSGMCAAAAIVDVAINALLLRRWGIVAAALSSTVAYVLLTLATGRWAAARSGLGLRELVPTGRDVRAIADNVRLIVRERRR